MDDGIDVDNYDVGGEHGGGSCHVQVQDDVLALLWMLPPHGAMDVPMLLMLIFMIKVMHRAHVPGPTDIIVL